MFYEKFACPLRYYGVITARKKEWKSDFRHGLLGRKFRKKVLKLRLSYRGYQPRQISVYKTAKYKLHTFNFIVRELYMPGKLKDF